MDVFLKSGKGYFSDLLKKKENLSGMDFFDFLICQDFLHYRSRKTTSAKDFVLLVRCNLENTLTRFFFSNKPELFYRPGKIWNAGIRYLLEL